MKTTHAILIALALLAGGNATAQTPIIVAPNGTYLGQLSANRFAADSVSNRFGQFGSPYSDTSINNQFSPYGSPYGAQSVNNPWATSAPRIYVPR